VGLARRAGFAVVGTQAVRDAARRGYAVTVFDQDRFLDNFRYPDQQLTAGLKLSRRPFKVVSIKHVFGPV